MNSTTFDQQGFRLLAPEERRRMRLLYRSYRKVLGMSRMVASTVVWITAREMLWAIEDRQRSHA